MVTPSPPAAAAAARRTRAIDVADHHALGRVSGLLDEIGHLLRLVGSRRCTLIAPSPQPRSARPASPSSRCRSTVLSSRSRPSCRRARRCPRRPAGSGRPSRREILEHGRGSSDLVVVTYQPQPMIGCTPVPAAIQRSHRDRATARRSELDDGVAASPSSSPPRGWRCPRSSMYLRPARRMPWPSSAARRLERDLRPRSLSERVPGGGCRTAHARASACGRARRPQWPRNGLDLAALFARHCGSP